MIGIICQICSKRPATSHLTELAASGGRLELHICATCTAELELNLASDPPPIAEILAKKAEKDETETDDGKSPSEPTKAALERETAASSTVCPSCGLSFAEFAAHNRFGCANCYTAFATQIEPLLARYHGTAVHTGRVPTATRGPQEDLVAKRSRLDSALRDAVSAEDYQQAARLRDELRQLGESTP